MKSFVVNAVANRWRWGILVAASCVLLAVGYFASGHVATASTIQAIVCREGAKLTIDAPLSDSVVSTTTVNLAGMVAQANQIEIAIDGQFDGVVPLNAAATTFTAAVQLAPGTHTIRLTAIDACQIANAVAVTVVTYQPAVVSSSGDQVPTEVTATGGVIVGPLTSVAPPQGATFAWLTTPLLGLGSSLDLVAAPGAASSMVAPLLHLGLFASGLAVIFLSSHLAATGVSGRWLRWMVGRFGLYSSTAVRGVTIAIGAGLIILTFIV